jgi:hypothetical protein
MVAPAANSQTIDLSLNVFFNDPSDFNSGGVWQLVGKSSHSGIAVLNVNLTNINPGAGIQAPRGIVNGSDPAGFSLLESAFPTHRRLGLFQLDAVPGPGEEQSAFYGVGTLPNGEPGDIGPAFTTLTNVQDVPWATGDLLGQPAWANAAMFASGTFPANVTPAFFAGSVGGVFLSLGTSMAFGDVMMATLTTTVRVAPFALFADYNRNGVVDAADYVVWRKGLGNADGNNNGTVGPEDYDKWRMEFGEGTNGAGDGGVSSAGAAPEPAGGLMLLFALASRILTRRQRA